MIRLLLIGIFSSVLIYSSSQDTSNNIIETQKLIYSIESSLEINEESIPYDILENLQDLQKNPININKCSSNELNVLPFLSEYQVNAFMDYRNQYGVLLSFAELLAVEGFNLQIAKTIMPYISLKTRVAEISIRQKRLKTISFIRYSRSLYPDENYFSNYQNDKSINSVYLGSPDKCLLKIQQESKAGINWGIIAEKDAGEAFNINRLPDSIQDEIAKTNKYGFDFYSGFIEYNGKSFLKKIILGDFQICVGQGLCIWSSGYFSDPSNPIQSIRYGKGIKANTSSYESSYFRGGASSFKFKNISSFVFYSNRLQDASLNEIKDNQTFSSFQNSGYHRSLNELRSKNSIQINQFGGSAEIHLAKGILGFSYINTKFSIQYFKERDEENIFAFNGYTVSNIGVHWNYTLRNSITFYGELCFTEFKYPSIISGIYISPKPYLDLSISYKQFNARHFNISANPARKGSFIPENNLQLCMAIDPVRNFELSACFNFIHFNWMRSGISKPSNYVSFKTSMTYKLSENCFFITSYNYKNYEQNHTMSSEYINPVINIKKNSYQLSVINILNHSFSSKSQLILNNLKSTSSTGSAFSQEINYNNENLRTKATVSCIVFDTDDNDSRVYVYEKNVLHAFSFPSYSGSGIGGFLLIKTEINRWISLWFRISKTKCFRNAASSETWKSKKSEISIQARIKL